MEKIMSTKVKHIVMFGAGDDGKARACRFDASQEPAVRKAAGLMNFRVGCPKTEQASALAAKLPEGALLNSGLVAATAIADDVFYKLAKLMTFDNKWNTTGTITGSPQNTDGALLKSADAMWSAITVGSMVLAFEFVDPEAFGWSAAIVLSISKDGQTLTLRWRDWPGRAFQAYIKSVALLRPDISP
jgi:hypothetical protein